MEAGRRSRWHAPGLPSAWAEIAKEGIYMMANAAKKPDEPTKVDVAIWSLVLQAVGGSKSDEWNNTIANQAFNALWLAHSTDETRHQQFSAILAVLIGIGPKDELEGMLAAQLIACHSVSMECYRRAMLGQQTFEGRRENLSQANKLSRTYATLLESLNRHRGKGAQKVTVEHVHVHEGGQAIVGNVEAPGGGVPSQSKDQPHALAYAPGTTMPSRNKTRDPVSVASDDERSMPDARGKVAGASDGK